MVRAPCCEKTGLKKGPWTPEEDQILVNHIRGFGHGNWRSLPKQAGLLRCGKSCRLRWMNYLRPDIKRGNFTKEEEETIVQLHQKLGNRWSAIAASLPGRTDNEIKNVWHTHLKRPLVDPNMAAGTQQQQKKKKKKRESSNTEDFSTSIINEFLEESEMERFWLDALSMNVIATETPTDQSNSTADFSSSTTIAEISINGDPADHGKQEDELHVVAEEIESFWLDDPSMSIDFASPSAHYHSNLFNSDNDMDFFWQEVSQLIPEIF